MIETNGLAEHIISKPEYIPDVDVEVYFKAADVLVLPYLDIYQSGVPFLAYNFGLPVIATDVGSLREDIIEGVTGYVCKRKDPNDLSNCIERYFNSDIFLHLSDTRQRIIEWANETYSWKKIGKKSSAVYGNLLTPTP
jgi:glycosyltransferase involved in cell wall biosynthesis